MHDKLEPEGAYYKVPISQHNPAFPSPLSPLSFPRPPYVLRVSRASSSYVSLRSLDIEIKTLRTKQLTGAFYFTTVYPHDVFLNYNLLKTSLQKLTSWVHSSLKTCKNLLQLKRFFRIYFYLSPWLSHYLQEFLKYKIMRLIIALSSLWLYNKS